MAGNFQGWLIKFGEVQLPNSFMYADAWSSTPNQRLEIDAYRDADALLHRETSENFKSKISIEIRELTLTERTALDNVIALASLPLESKKQRRVNLTYWNDEELAYKQGVFYIADITYSIHKIEEEKKDIVYNPFTISLTEY